MALTLKIFFSKPSKVRGYIATVSCSFVSDVMPFVSPHIFYRILSFGYNFMNGDLSVVQSVLIDQIR